MASQNERVRLSNCGDQNKHHMLQQQHGFHHHTDQISFGMMQSSSSSPAPIPAASFNISCKDGDAYELGELDDQDLFLYLHGHEQSAHDHRQNSWMRPPPTLNIFPSMPMHVEPSPTTSKTNTGLVSSPATIGSKRSSEPSMELSNPRNDVTSAPQPTKAVKREGNRKGPISSSEQEAPKTSDPKTLRRLAQNREAARKSRLRKKAYVQQLESSRMRLTQLEQAFQKARSQGYYLGGNSILPGDQNPPVSMGNITSDAALFDMEYGRWLEDHHHLTAELGNALIHDHLPENELRMLVDTCLAHYDQVMKLKSIIVKTDVFHLVSGTWKTPAERCFMWIGGIRPSQLIKIILSQIEPLTEQQLMGIRGLQQSTQEAEEALSIGLEALNQSLSETISLTLHPNMSTYYMGQMALAINKLSALQGFVTQADTLRHQTLHGLHQLLTTRQAARCFVAIAEHFDRLRVLSSLWMARRKQE